MKYKPAIVAAFFLEVGLPIPQFELAHIPGRKFRLDVAWPNPGGGGGVGIEVNGGVWSRGAHGRGKGIVRDYEKNNLALLTGWRILQILPADLCTLETATMVLNLRLLK